MLRNVLVYYFGSNLIECSERAGLISAHESPVSDNIGSEDSSQTPFHVGLKSRRTLHPSTAVRALDGKAIQFTSSTESPLRIIPSLSTAP